MLLSCGPPAAPKAPRKSRWSADGRAACSTTRSEPRLGAAAAAPGGDAKTKRDAQNKATTLTCGMSGTSVTKIFFLKKIRLALAAKPLPLHHEHSSKPLVLQSNIPSAAYGPWPKRKQTLGRKGRQGRQPRRFIFKRLEGASATNSKQLRTTNCQPPLPVGPLLSSSCFFAKSEPKSPPVKTVPDEASSKSFGFFGRRPAIVRVRDGPGRRGGRKKKGLRLHKCQVPSAIRETSSLEN